MSALFPQLAGKLAIKFTMLHENCPHAHNWGSQFTSDALSNN
jgi:hypothetical protein